MSRPSRIFGITTDLSGNLDSGIIANSFNTTKSVETAEARDEKGKLLDIAAYSRNEEISVNGLYVSSGCTEGGKVTIGGKDYLITSVSKNESNTDFQRSDVSLRGGDNDTVIHTLTDIQGE